MSKFAGLVVISSAVAFLGSGGYVLIPTGVPVGAREVVDPKCDIKGNISIDTGERIYHVPGQKYYAETRISPEYGEQWFCSEADARAAGWRKSKR
ncbi:hypothetical protein [Rhizobium sp. BK376]|uniref:sunset domain-containing protein n=1 Tax=Rhizobium sp. BK376 TaxID=2512149 RepID=UPI00104BB550|nr:hypothetical protein [Rhizobium sp. BK376]TCR72217.1 hypothetical protein EV561_13042 [Rhizobium sp. BK376]